MCGIADYITDERIIGKIFGCHPNIFGVRIMHGKSERLNHIEISYCRLVVTVATEFV